MEAPLYFTKPALRHIHHFVDGMLSAGFTGTLTDIHRESLHERDRRTLSHFLSHGNWNRSFLQRITQRVAFQEINKTARQDQSPIFVILDDTLCEKTKPSSQAVDTIQGASFQYSHLKDGNVYGHTVVQALLRTGDEVYPFALERYDPEGKSKIDLACDITFFGFKTHYAMSDERIITAATITTGEKSDGKQLQPLIEKSVAAGVTVKTVIGDTAYSEKDNLIYTKGEHIIAFIASSVPLFLY
ncbi:transposase [Paenibacillus sp. F411]|nr:transposase [Paenibacillus sp. F411]